MKRKYGILGIVAVILGGGVLLLRPLSSSDSKPSRIAFAPTPEKRQYTPEDLLRAILADEVDPYGDRDVLRSVLSGMDAATRDQWMSQIAMMLAALDPVSRGNLQRRMGFFALAQGHLDAGWTMLKPLLDCPSCPANAKNDALRLLDQYTPADDLRRQDLTNAVVARANEILASDSKDVGQLPLVWSAFAHLRQDGRLSDSVTMQQLYIARFAGTIDARAMNNAQQTLAHDLINLGQRNAARPLFNQVAEYYRGSAMSQSRADYLVHAARAGEPSEAINLLEGALRNTGELQTTASSLVYLELLNSYVSRGQASDAASVADRFWTARSSFSQGSDTAENAAANAEYQAMVCYRAATLAEQQGRSADANTWLYRAIDAAPASRTAATIRQQLHIPAP